MYYAGSLLSAGCGARCRFLQKSERERKHAGQGVLAGNSVGAGEVVEYYNELSVYSELDMKKQLKKT